MFEAYPESAARERHARGRADHFTVTLEACRYGVIGPRRRSGSNRGANETSRCFSSFWAFPR